jgi:hypothetical protein
MLCQAIVLIAPVSNRFNSKLKRAGVLEKVRICEGSGDCFALPLGRSSQKVQKREEENLGGGSK